MAQINGTTSQVILIHISDLHFGGRHRFSPPRTPLGDQPEDAAFPSLLDKLLSDLDEPDPGCPVLICVTGDIVETAEIKEYQKAEDFVRGLAEAPILGRPRGLGCTFLVPGNHDVMFSSSDIGIRWQPWTEFFNRTFGTHVVREEPWAFAKLHDRIEDLNAVIVTLNSSIYVEKDKPGQDRGNVDIRQLTKLEEQLEAIDPTRLRNCVRVALIHHHPVLLPPLAEPGRSYDAVHNSGKLLAILRRYGFHAVLHGHKHNPHTFTDDTLPAHEDTREHPILIAAGGSVGSTELPHSPRIANCYNRITVKWHPDGYQARVHVVTRGLRIFNEDGTERLPTRWNWFTMRVDDRHFFELDHAPAPKATAEREFDEEADKSYEEARHAEYARTRGNLPAAEVHPSLIPGQAYEVILWIERHPYGVEKPDKDKPVQVVWSAGRKFEVVTVTGKKDPHYVASMAYWGPMLVQARMIFSDGEEALAYIYARMPGSYEDGAN